MDAITKLLTELKDLGFSKEQVEELLDIAEQEIRDAVLEDLAYNGEEAKVQEYLQKFEAVKSDPQGFATTFDEAMGTLYGA
jgi:DNA-binding transcriptional MerR regulator